MQVVKIRLLLRERGLYDVRVGTVDDYQGQEERIVFISTVLSRPESLPQSATAAGRAAAGKEDSGRDDPHLGFWQNPKRFNVAITRAKALLVVVGHPAVLMQDANWRQLVRYCAARGAYRGAGYEAMQRVMRQPSHPAEDLPLGKLDWGESAGAGGSEEPDDLAAVVGQIAEMALLGAGDADMVYPETLDEYYASMFDEMTFRVAL